MVRTRFPLALLLLIVVLAPSAAAGDDSLADRQPRIRTTDARLRRLLEQGTRESPTLRALVERLAASDVVVYLQCERVHGQRLHDGRLTFLSTVGGFRYVVVRLAFLGPSERQIAILAHELQHAVEVADTPAIVDTLSLEREYRRMGFLNNRNSSPGVAFDTKAAVATGEQVFRETMALDGD